MIDERVKFLRRISIVLGIVALSLVAYFVAVKASSLTAADVTDNTALRIPEITFDEQTGIASVEISVMIYNVCGLPWPIACGKTSRQTDKPWYETQDLQGWVSGKRVSIEPIRVEAAFNEPVDGLMPSDHNALVVIYRLSWQVPND